MEFKEERGIAYCGKVCVLCRLKGHEDCHGCAATVNGREDDCFIRQCVRKKGIDGCCVCGDYPCCKDYLPLQNKRKKAFLRYAREFGKQALIDRLHINYENGITYQESSGDYDALETEYEIYKLLRYGRKEADDEKHAGAETKAAPDIIIKPLSSELMADYFDFFNNRAFTDNPPWGGCYCTAFQMTKEEEKTELWDRAEAYGGGQENFMRALREIVVRQITSGALRGYLAYIGGVSIGWCNVNNRANFPAESANGFRLFAPAENREKAVICFEIAPEYRGKGVAAALLTRIVNDAGTEGYAAVEGFPHGDGKRNEWDFTGPARLYEKLGFTAITRQDGSVIMRKELDDQTAAH
jgi:GNAT superfamily N-acetyltransferase